MKTKKEGKNPEKRFRIRSKRLFLTYPQVLNIPNLEELFIKSLNDSIDYTGSGMEYLIAEEKHEDGTPHIHVYLEFETTQYINSRKPLEVKLINPDTGEEVIQVGKYEPVKNKHKVLKYILKNIDLKTEELTLKNTNMTLPILNSVYYDSPEEHLIAVIETKGLDESLSTLLTCYKKLIIKKGTAIVTNLRLMNELKQKLLNKSLTKIRDLSEFTNIPPEIFEWREQTPPKTSLILYGPSNTGKTELAKSILSSMGRDVIFCRDRNMLRNESISSETSAILFDDLSMSHLSREEIIHMLDIENISHVRVLYAVVYIPAFVPRIFTTNDINRVLKPVVSFHIPQEILRRVTLVRIDQPLQLHLNINLTIDNFSPPKLKSTKNL
jgi:hypothetical protein